MFGNCRQFQNEMDCEERKRRRLNDKMNVRKEERERIREKKIGNLRNGRKTLRGVMDFLDENENEQGQKMIDSIWNGEYFDGSIIEMLKNDWTVMSLLFVESLMLDDEKLSQRNLKELIEFVSTIEIDDNNEDTENEAIVLLSMSVCEIAIEYNYQSRKELTNCGLLSKSIERFVHFIKKNETKVGIDIAGVLRMALHSLIVFTKGSGNETKAAIGVGSMDLILQSMESYGNDKIIRAQIMTIIRNMIGHVKVDQLNISKDELKRILKMVSSVLNNDDSRYGLLLHAAHILFGLLKSKNKTINEYMQYDGLNVVIEHIINGSTRMDAREELVRMGLHIVYKMLKAENGANESQIVKKFEFESVTEAIEPIVLQGTASESTIEIATQVLFVYAEATHRDWGICW